MSVIEVEGARPAAGSRSRIWVGGYTRSEFWLSLETRGAGAFYPPLDLPS